MKSEKNWLYKFHPMEVENIAGRPEGNHSEFRI